MLRRSDSGNFRRGNHSQDATCSKSENKKRTETQWPLAGRPGICRPTGWSGGDVKKQSAAGLPDRAFLFFDRMRAGQSKPIALPISSYAQGAAQWNMPWLSSRRLRFHIIGHAIPHLWDSGCYQNGYIILLKICRIL